MKKLSLKGAPAALLLVWLLLVLYPTTVSAADEHWWFGDTAVPWHIKWDAEPLDLKTWQGWAGLLGGVELSGSIGSATVTSGIRRESGEREIVAGGNGSQSGFEISLFPRPRKTGFALSPTGGFLSQSVSIADFMSDVPTNGQPSEGEDIGASCSNPDTGEARPCQTRNVYDLTLASGYLGAQGSANLVVVVDDAEWFATTWASVGAIEYRSVAAKVYQGTNESSGWRLFRSFGAGFDVGWIDPKSHLGLRGGIDHRRFLRFEYDKPLEFRSGAQWDPDRQIHLRPRVFVDDASISIWTFKVAAAFVF